MESYWSETAKGISGSKEPLAGRTVENIVIGGGMAGMLTAYFLHKRGKEVVVLEANAVGSGQTAGTTAKITVQHGLIYDHLINTFGLARARQYADANRTAIERYRQIIEGEEIDCGFTRIPAYLYTRVNGDLLRREAEAAQKVGISAFVEEDSELPFEIMLAMGFDNQAIFNPLQFLHGIAKGIEVHTRVQVCEIRDRQVETNEGCITGGNIIFACHYPFVNSPGYYFARMHTERSYVLALENTRKFCGMYLGIDQSGLSLRMDGDRLLFGGGGHRTGEHRAGGSYDMLRHRARELWKDCREIAAWSAQDCMTGDRVPYIGHFSSTRDHWYVATGFNKWGMTSSMVAAEVLADLICDGRAIGREIFSPQRFSPMGTLRQGAVQSAKSAGGLLRRFFEGPRADIDDLPTGHGGIVGEGERRAGVYKTPDGEVWAVDPVCPHMGCLLEWNPDEKSWDCPCHGSRFDYTGKRICGPGERGLQGEQLAGYRKK